MIFNFAIAPLDFQHFSDVIVGEADRSPNVLVIDQGLLGRLVVCCLSETDANNVNNEWSRTGRVGDGYSTIEISPSGKLMIVRQNGIESQAALAEFLAPLLRVRASLRLVDQDAGADISTADDETLFGDPDII